MCLLKWYIEANEVSTIVNFDLIGILYLSERFLAEVAHEKRRLHKPGQGHGILRPVKQSKSD